MMGDIMSVELTRRGSGLVRFHRNEPIDRHNGPSICLSICRRQWESNAHNAAYPVDAGKGPGPHGNIKKYELVNPVGTK